MIKKILTLSFIGLLPCFESYGAAARQDRVETDNAFSSSSLPLPALEFAAKEYINKVNSIDGSSTHEKLVEKMTMFVNGNLSTAEHLERVSRSWTLVPPFEDNDSMIRLLDEYVEIVQKLWFLSINCKLQLCGPVFMTNPMEPLVRPYYQIRQTDEASYIAVLRKIPSENVYKWKVDVSKDFSQVVLKKLKNSSLPKMS